MSTATTGKRFAVIGSAGFAAPHHMRAVRESGGARVAAMDPRDSVGVIDEYFPDAAFFTEFERESGRRLWPVLQLRLHRGIRAFRESLAASPNPRRSVRLTHVTTRGDGYRHGWKGQIEKSGGVSTNIGIHFLEMLQWLFGAPA